jgi:hypothetical protein
MHLCKIFLKIFSIKIYKCAHFAAKEFSGELCTFNTKKEKKRKRRMADGNPAADRIKPDFDQCLALPHDKLYKEIENLMRKYLGIAARDLSTRARIVDKMSEMRDTVGRVYSYRSLFALAAEMRELDLCKWMVETKRYEVSKEKSRVATVQIYGLITIVCGADREGRYTAEQTTKMLSWLVELFGVMREDVLSDPDGVAVLDGACVAQDMTAAAFLIDKFGITFDDASRNNGYSLWISLIPVERKGFEFAKWLYGKFGQKPAHLPPWIEDQLSQGYSTNDLKREMCTYFSICRHGYNTPPDIEEESEEVDRF